MIVDVVLAVAMIAVAAGTIPEFQIGIGYIGSAANTAFMCVGCFYFSSGGFVGSGGGEGNRAGFLCGFLFKQPFRVDAPSNRYHIENIFAKEEVVGAGPA